MLKFTKRYSRAILLALCFTLSLCADNSKIEKKSGNEVKPKKGEVNNVKDIEEMKRILDLSGDSLLIFDLYADWCVPCRILSPLLAEIAKEYSDIVKIYKVNVDKNPDIANALGTTGIPFVVYVKNKTGVYALTGVQSKETYVRAIKLFSDIDAQAPSASAPHGDIVEGIRVVRLSTATNPGNIYVYRGETVRLIIDKIEFPYSIHIPEYGISQEGTIGKDLEVTFKAENIGVFPIFCNGKCPTGDGTNYGQIVVMDFEKSSEGKFKELSTDKAVEFIKSSNPLILDVRTPNEYYGGHIENAKLIPLQQLESRLSELTPYKDKEILVYCRSGNRSTVASEILLHNGFKKLYNLRPGVKGWQKSGNKLVK